MPALPSTPAPRPATWLQRHGAALGVLLIVAAVFAPALAGEFVYDDLVLIVRNPGLHDPGDVLGLWTRPLWGDQLGHWRPLTAQLLAVAWWLGDGQPWPVHVLALGCHLAATLAVLGLLRRGGATAPMAIAAALLFALHPAQAENVAWCAAINDPLAGCCTLWSLRWWLLAEDRADVRHAALALAAAAAALLAKESGVLAPLLLLGAEIARGRPRRIGRLAAPLALLAGYWLLRMAVFGDLAGGLGRTSEATEGTSLLRAGDVAGGLAAHLFVPIGLGMFGAAGRAAATHAVCALLTVGAAAWVWRRRPELRLGALLIVVPLALPAATVPSLGPYPIADRYLYLACAGLALAAARDTGRRRHGSIGVGVCAAAAALGTHLRLDTWRDQQTFVAIAVADHPDDPRPQAMRGAEALQRVNAGDRSQLPAAAAAFARARELLGPPPPASARDPLRVVRADVATGAAWCDLLQADGEPGRALARAEQQFLAVTQTWPDRADGWVGLGVAHAASGHLGPAEQAFRRAIAIDPGTGAAHHNLGRVLLQQGDPAGALAELIEALRLWPGDSASRALLDQIDRRR